MSLKQPILAAHSHTHTHIHNRRFKLHSGKNLKERLTFFLLSGAADEGRELAKKVRSSDLIRLQKNYVSLGHNWRM